MTDNTSAKVHGVLHAGVGRVDITHDTPSQGVVDRLYARALVVDDGQTRVAIVTMDVTAINGRSVSCHMLPDVADDFMSRLRSRVQGELGINSSHVLVNASHTHQPGKMLCDDDQQIERTFSAIKKAAGSLVEVKIGAGVGREDRLTTSRTLILKNGNHSTIRHSHPCPPDDQVAGLGPIDPDIGVLRVDRLDGTPLAVLYNFASHLLFGCIDGQITANFPGVASALIEETLGHDVMAFFIQGAAGDIIDITFKDFSQPRDIKPLGITLGLSTLRAWRAITTHTAGDVRVVSQTIDLPRRTDIPARIATLIHEQEQLLDSLRGTTLNFDSFLPLYLQRAADLCREPVSQGRPQPLHHGLPSKTARQAMDVFNGKLMDQYMCSIRAMEKLAEIRDNIATLQKHQTIIDNAGQAAVPAEIQGMRIGDFVLLAAPIEVLAEVGMNIKTASPHRHTFIAGYSNGYLHYGAPADHYDKGGYEITECMLDSAWQKCFEQTANQILHKL